MTSWFHLSKYINPEIFPCSCWFDFNISYTICPFFFQPSCSGAEATERTESGRAHCVCVCVREELCYTLRGHADRSITSMKPVQGLLMVPAEGGEDTVTAENTWKVKIQKPLSNKSLFLQNLLQTSWKFFYGGGIIWMFNGFQRTSVA